MSFGTNLSALRKQRGLSQEEFGEALGVSRQTIYTWEADISSPNIENLRAIADYFGCTVDQLIRGEAFGSLPDASGAAEPDAAPVCRGDKAEITAFIHRFAFRIALATSLILFGVAALCALGEEPKLEGAGLTAFFLALCAAVILYIYSGITHASFMERPENQNAFLLYTKEEKQAETRRFAAVLAGAVGGILLGVLFLCLAYERLSESEPAWPAAVFMGILAVCVGLIINFSIRLSKYDAAKSAAKQNKTAEAIHSILWMVTVAAYLLMGFVWNLWHPGWIIFVISGFASGIINILFEQKDEK